jgi:phosphatidate cytidylyltransferase
LAFSLNNPLLLRVISAVALMPIVLAALWWGGWYFLGMIFVAIALSVKEWAFIARHIIPFPKSQFIAGLIYLTICFSSFAFLRMDTAEGAALAIGLISTIWASDSGAYFAGKMIGGPKLAPSISPKKTWAGFFGGMISSAAFLAFYFLYIAPLISDLDKYDDVLTQAEIIKWALLGAFITVTGQAGDLLESHYKRQANVKDSGSLIPGHGGLLDRIDALLLSAPFFLLGLKVLGL